MQFQQVASEYVHLDPEWNHRMCIWIQNGIMVCASLDPGWNHRMCIWIQNGITVCAFGSRMESQHVHLGSRMESQYVHWWIENGITACASEIQNGITACASEIQNGITACASLDPEIYKLFPRVKHMLSLMLWRSAYLNNQLILLLCRLSMLF